MTARVVLLLALLLLALPAAAQESDFATRLLSTFGDQNFAEAIRLVKTHPAEAEAMFGEVEAGLEATRKANPQKALQHEALLNFLARVFQLELQRQDLALRLQAQGKLFEDSVWAGSLLAGTTTTGPAPAPSADSAATFLARAREVMDEGPLLHEAFRLHAHRLNFASSLRDAATAYLLVHDFREVLLPRLDALLDKVRVLWQQARDLGASDEQMEQADSLLQQYTAYQAFLLQAWKALEVAQLGDLGLYSEATRKGEEALGLVTDPEALTVLRYMLVAVGVVAGQPDLVRRHLEGLAPQNPVYAFPVESVRFEEELRSNPDMTAETFLKRHEQAWAILKRLPPEGFNSHVGYGIRIWVLAAADLAARLDEPERARIQEIMDADVAALAARSDRGWKGPVLAPGPLALNPEWNPELLFSLLDLHLALAERARLVGDTARAARELRQVEARMPALEVAVPELEIAAQKLFAGSEIRPDIRRGALSLLPGRVLEEKGRQGAPGVAGPAFEKALALYERAAAVQPRLLLLPDYALALGEAGDRARALQVADQAVQEAERAGHRAALALALAARGRLRGSVEDLQKGTGMLEALVTELGGLSPQSRRLQQAASPAYDLLARLQTEAGRGEDAFATLARKQQVEGFGATAPTNARTVEIQAMRSRMAGLEQERLALSGLPETPELQVLKARNSELLASTRSDFYSRLGDLYREEPAYQRLAIRPVVYGQIQALLPADTVVLQYLPSEKHTYVFVLTREAMRVRRVDVTESELEAGVVEFRGRMSTFTSAVESGTAAPSWVGDGSDAWTRQVQPLQRLLATLHSLLIDPVEEDLQGKEVVAIIPTGDLMYLPFAALGRPRGQDLEFLAERKQVVTLVKASDLLQVSSAERMAPGPVVAFGNPDGSLKAAEQEVAALKAVFPDARVYVGGEASYEHLRGVVAQVGYLHLATHGVLDSTPAQNHLVLAGLPSERLTMGDIADLQLGPTTRLVTLSGCQTAMNSRNPETELLQSVADAFGFAGSPSVLASLWRVADESTRDLMVEFYRGLKAGDSLAGALQGAEKALMKDPARRHPFYWAPFVLIGDWR